MFNEVIAQLMMFALLLGLAPIVIEMITDYLPKRKVVNKDDYERFQ